MENFQLIYKAYVQFRMLFVSWDTWSIFATLFVNTIFTAKIINIFVVLIMIVNKDIAPFPQVQSWLSSWPTEKSIYCSNNYDVNNSDDDESAVVDDDDDKTSQELRMLSSVTLNCQVAKIVMNSGSQLSEM